MQITQTVKEVLETASAKALATKNQETINVVPVSMIRVNDSTIWLFDFFMNKTTHNVCSQPVCALTAWKDMKGVQITGTVTYITEGGVFDESVNWARTQNPDRIVKGLLVIEPTVVFDISPGGTYSSEELGCGT